MSNYQLLSGKGSNILVAAAAGSGKTAVLVERIINKIINDKIDIDKILVVTFTNAAASEMRERILNALYKKIDQDPLNLRLRKQIVLLNKASICTIDSFCLDVIRNNFFKADVSSNFRIADNIELELLKQEAIEEVFEESYVEDDSDFSELVKLYAGYKDDENLKNIVLKIHNFIQSAPFPIEWLNEKIDMFNPSKVENFADTVWGKIIIRNFRDELENSVHILRDCKMKSENIIELSKYTLILEDDINQILYLEKSLDNWDLAYEIANNIKFKTWPSDKKIVSNLKDEMKQTRDNIKKRLKTAIEQTFIYTTEQAIEDIEYMYIILEKLKNVVLNFEKKFEEKKSAKNIMDFSDIEHIALKILLEKNEKGVYQKTEVAKKYEEKFDEIAIDEYQDSNLVQEFILTSISNMKNIFMVGDVKQSIYRFRQARPELFLDKYDKYGSDTNEYGRKIKLFKNFRSRENVLDTTNLIFQDIMSQGFGEIEYDKSEYLNLGAEYEDKDSLFVKTEIDIIDLKQEQIDEESDDENDSESNELLEKTEIEAKYVAKKIKELIDSKYQVSDKKDGYRNITYKDIVILLRATAGVSNIFEKELINLDIPVFSDQAENYLESIEIKTIIATLKIIDNPYRDIELVTVMRSIIGDFSDNDLIEIRLAKQDGFYYEAVKEALNSNEISNDLKNKINTFLNNIENWRKEEKYLPLNELILKIYNQTDYYNYVRLMPNGDVRKANLKLLIDKAKDYEKISFKGLFNFIRYLEKVKNSSTDMQSAKLIGENENVVRIMSIHKSKGLEFPVAIISRADKKFNLRDLSDSILMHQDIGFGMQYINYERRIEYTTATKEAIKIKTREEAIAEEMRILYVALTRAKEKIIITGVENDFEKSIEQKRELLKIYERENGKINHLLLKKFLSYLGWIELCYLSHKDIEDEICLNRIAKQDVLNEDDVVNESCDFDIGESSIEDLDYIDKILNWKYDFEEMTSLQSKLSVTKIKELKSGLSKEKSENNIDLKPKFMIEETAISSAERGTILHLVLQKLDLKKEYSKSDLRSFIDDLCFKKQITENQKGVINIEKLYTILNSEFFRKIRNAKEIKKEIPFYTYIDTKEVYGTENSENVLVQGIVDLFFVDEAGRLVLVDYKTDYTVDGSDLVDKYRVQLEIYKKALEEAVGRCVDEVVVYSIYLNRGIDVLM